MFDNSLKANIMKIRAVLKPPIRKEEKLMKIATRETNFMVVIYDTSKNNEDGTYSIRNKEYFETEQDSADGFNEMKNTWKEIPLDIRSKIVIIRYRAGVSQEGVCWDRNINGIQY